MNTSKRRKSSEESIINKPAAVDWNYKSPSKLTNKTELAQTSWLKSCPGLFPTSFPQPSSFSSPRAPMVVCFVCGHPAFETSTLRVHSRVQPDRAQEPFFPFLEYHDPAPGAEPMRADWSVVVCFVCNAFLLQQWEAFERSKTPVGKRLYWLKRPSGCEIRQPVSQIELEEILNEHSRDDDDEACDSDSEQHKRELQQATPKRTSPPTQAAAKPAESFTRKPPPSPPRTSHKPPSPVHVTQKPQPTQKPHSKPQTLSLPHPNHQVSNNPPKEVAKKHAERTESPIVLPLVVCYSCGQSKQLNFSICPVHCRPSYEQLRVGVPFYPSVLDRAGAEGTNLLNSSITFVCIKCLPKYPPQWHPVQEDFLKQFHSKATLPRIPLPEEVSCYLCSDKVNTKFNDGLVSFDGKGMGKALHALLSSRKMAAEAVPLSFGFTYLCAGCMKVTWTKVAESKVKEELAA